MCFVVHERCCLPKWHPYPLNFEQMRLCLIRLFCSGQFAGTLHDAKKPIKDHVDKALRLHGKGLYVVSKLSTPVHCDVHRN